MNPMLSPANPKDAQALRPFRPGRLDRDGLWRPQTGRCRQSRRPPARRGGETPSAQPVSEPELGEAQGICCRRCGRLITHREEAIAVQGEQRHTFANPHGIVYQIGLFRHAPGCLPIGGYCGEFSWFAGYRWRIVLCVGCREHLGWHFAAAAGDGFHGLILERLIEAG